MLAELGGMDEGYRLYGDGIDLAYRAREAGWERWYVPQAVVIHHHQAVTDRRFLTRRTLALAEHHALRPEASRGACEKVMKASEQFDPAVMKGQLIRPSTSP